MANPEASATISVVLAYSPAAREVREWSLQLPPGSTAAQALLASALFAEFPALSLNKMSVGVWGRSCPLDQVLQDGDRLEVYRPLRVDPKVARRERFKGQGTKGAKGAGLFAKRRVGAKAGY